MGVVDLFFVASMPILKVLLITALGSFLALNRINILGETATHHINKVVYFVFGPALVCSNLAKTITFKHFLTLWFMLVNVLITFLMGSAMGWILGKVTKTPKHVKGLILASCSAGNLGNLPYIILPAMCKEKGSPFGAPDVCERFGLAYASLSMAVYNKDDKSTLALPLPIYVMVAAWPGSIGSIYFWLYAYNIVRITSKEVAGNGGVHVESLANVPESELPPIHSSDIYSFQVSRLSNSSTNKVVIVSSRIKHYLRIIYKEFNLKAILAPSTIGALLMENNAPLRIVGDTGFMIGDASIPCSTLILGANLLRGLKGSGIQVTTIIGIIAVRYIFLPLLGILVVKGAVLAGFVKTHDIYFQFALLLQYGLPPAISIGTVTELFGAGQKECSVIMLWTNILAPVTLTLWCTFYLWLLS